MAVGGGAWELSEREQCGACGGVERARGGVESERAEVLRREREDEAV